MTADGADRGTLEYYDMIRSKAGRKWLLKDAPVRLFAEMTGPLPKNFDKKKLLANTAYYILPLLQNLQQYSIRENLRAAYEGGKITPELLEILDTPPAEYTPDELEGKEKYNIIATLIHEGKLNFEPFRGKTDIETNWPFFYRLDFSPLPDFRYRLKDLHYVSDTLDNVIKPQIRTYVLIALEGKETFVSAEDDGRKEKQATPLTAADFIGFAELIESQYNARIAENTPLDWPAPFKVASAGFYINPKTYVIKDLRPYTKEITALLSLSSWDYLKDFADVIREAVAYFQQEQEKTRQQVEGSGEGLLQSLFPDVYYNPKEESKNFRNLPVSKAEKRLIAAYASARISGSSIVLADGTGKPLQTVDFIDLNGNPSTETIRPFDVSIMNCVGSLQQKSPDKKGFTDIEIAKEFCSTQDKKGHITPESPIVKDVREAMRRLNAVFGKMDITEEIKKEAERRHPDQKKLDRLLKGSKRFAIAQPLVNVKNIAVHTLKNDKDTLLYIIDGAPLFYLHAAITHQIAQVPFEQMNSKRNLTTEIRLLREQTRAALETAIAMRKRNIGGDSVRFNTILDATFRTSADKPENPARVEETEIVKKI